MSKLPLLSIQLHGHGKKTMADDWKKEVAEVLKKHGKMNESTVGELVLVVQQGGVRDALWQRKKVE